jgi:hypothetical protein
MDEQRRKELEAMGFRVEQFDIHNLKMGLSPNQIADAHHWVAYLYPNGKNGIFWGFPMPQRPVTEAECWDAIEHAVQSGGIDFEIFNGRQRKP